MSRDYDRWNPDCADEGRQDLICIRCCLDDGKSLPLCECNRKPGYTADNGFYTFTELKDDEKCICKKKDDNTEQKCVASNNKCTASTGACSTVAASRAETGLGSDSVPALGKTGDRGMPTTTKVGIAVSIAVSIVAIGVVGFIILN